MACNFLKLTHPHKNRSQDPSLPDHLPLHVRRHVAPRHLRSQTRRARAAYGDNTFGQGCLLARRLSESGVRSVEVQLGGWDTHQENFARVGTLAALIGDLADFNATIAYGLGLPLDQRLFSPSARPFTLAHRGDPATELFS